MTIQSPFMSYLTFFALHYLFYPPPPPHQPFCEGPYFASVYPVCHIITFLLSL